MNWSDNSLELADFADALEAAGYVDNAVDVIRKPYKYEAEHDAWVAQDYPNMEDENWDAFVEDISETEVEDE